MSGNTFGRRFRVTTFGESHGPGVGAVIDGCPARMQLSEQDLQPQLDRRRPGQSDLTTPRQERDVVQVLSGLQDGLTLGSPVTLWVQNQDQRPKDYSKVIDAPRPSHADFTYRMKYGITAKSGGGRASARETVARVAAGALAEKLLAERWSVRIVAWVSSAGTIAAPEMEARAITREDVDRSPTRCPDPNTAEQMAEEIAAARNDKDSLGGVIACACLNVPQGWGDPVFDKLDAALAAGMLSIPASKGFDVGSGFAGTRLRGSVHNDPFVMKDGTLGTTTNHSGGIQGGISNGEPVLFRVAFKPVATIGKPQETVDYGGNPVALQVEGRHDPCVLPRAVPIVESMAALVLADMAPLA